MKVTIRYVTKLILQNETYIFSFPIPAVPSSSNTDEAQPGEVKGLSVNISAHMSSLITEIKSSTHPIKSQRTNCQTSSVSENPFCELGMEGVNSSTYKITAGLLEHHSFLIG